ncbi:MAG: hypothetical protein R3D55_23295 [Chloroflexota bacterium]
MMDLEKLRVILLANFVGHGAAFVIFLASRLNGAGDATMWLAVGYTLLATLVYGYFLDRPRFHLPGMPESHASKFAPCSRY